MHSRLSILAVSQMAMRQIISLSTQKSKLEVISLEERIKFASQKATRMNRF